MEDNSGLVSGFYWDLLDKLNEYLNLSEVIRPLFR